MGDQDPSISSKGEIIAIDPDYQSDITKDNGGIDTEKKKNDEAPDDETKEKEDAGMGNYIVCIPSPVSWW